MLPVVYLGPAKQFIKKIKEKPLKNLFKNAIDEIRINPTIGEPKKGDLAGIWGYDLYHVGINYEIAYRISENDDGEIVVVIMAGSREGFWDELKKRML